jgi:hypothetical protein
MVLTVSSNVVIAGQLQVLEITAATYNMADTVGNHLSPFVREH